MPVEPAPMPPAHPRFDVRDDVLADDVLADDLATQMADLAGDLQASHDDLEVTLDSITSAATEVIPGVDFACVAVVSKDGEVNSLSATDPAAEKINAVQQQVQRGPCLSALWDEPVVHVADTRHDARWPEYAAAAADLGVVAVLSLRLYVQDHVLGALSLYSRRPGGFGPESIELATIYARHASLGFAHAEETAQMQTAIDHRDVIGQAKGILMERFKITGRQAFRILVKASQNTNVSLHRIAARLADTGELLVTLPAHRADGAPRR